MAIQRDSGIATQRIEALTDGVFAIATTILILDFSVPLVSKEVASGDLIPTLTKLLPHLYSYVLSFFVLGMLWSGHRIEFNSIKRSDGTLVLLNLTYLMFIALIPFLTVLIGGFFLAPLPLLLYGVNFLLILACRMATWHYATRNFRLVNPDIHPELVHANYRVILSAIIFVTLATVVACFSPLAANIIYYVMFLFYIATIIRASSII